jgi:hypothetical protein
MHRWLSLLASFGVIGGFVLIAFQLDLNTEAIRLRNATELNRDDREVVVRIATNYLTFSFGQSYWKHIKEGYYPPDFVAAIDDALSSMDRDLLETQFRGIVNDIEQLPPADGVSFGSDR